MSEEQKLYDETKIKYNIYSIIPVDVIEDLPPYKLNNYIYNNLNNAVKKYNGICYKNYGYIQEVQKIIKFDQGILMNEDVNANVRYQITLQCKVCLPFINDLYYARIDNIDNPSFITLISGPMVIYVKPENNKIKYPELLSVGKYVVIKVLNLQLFHMERYIIVIGELLDIVNDDEKIKKMFEKQYDN